MIPVGVAQEVSQHVDVDVDAGWTEGAHDGEDVIRGPARHERPQDQGNRLQGFLRPVLRLEFLLLFPSESDSFSYLVYHRGCGGFIHLGKNSYEK